MKIFHVIVIEQELGSFLIVTRGNYPPANVSERLLGCLYHCWERCKNNVEIPRELGCLFLSRG